MPQWMDSRLDCRSHSLFVVHSYWSQLNAILRCLYLWPKTQRLINLNTFLVVCLKVLINTVLWFVFTNILLFRFKSHSRLIEFPLQIFYDNFNQYIHATKQFIFRKIYYIVYTQIYAFNN